MSIKHYSEFSGAGGTSSGADAVPGVETIAAANHNKDAIESHQANFPKAEHFQEDITKLPIGKMPWAHLATFSPACPGWTGANGLPVEFDRSNAENPELFDSRRYRTPDDPKTAKRKEEYKRSRLLMKEVPRYLRAKAEAGQPVPIGWVENVWQCRKWVEWDSWLDEIRKLGYRIRVIAFNSMHAVPVRTLRAPQSRDRLYVAFWHESLRRDPDWDKWLRPKAYCSTCDRQVLAVQVFKDPTQDMGCYGVQYVYQCPTITCRNREVFPEVMPALSIIDPRIAGIRIGDRADLGMTPLAPATRARIVAGIRKFWLPLLTPVGGTWRADGDLGAQPLNRPMPTRTTRETDGIAVPPLLVPVEGRDGKRATSAARPLRTQTTRLETGLLLPFIAPLRGGGERERARDITEPLTTVTASGNHHGLALPPHMNAGELSAWARQLLVPYFSGSEYARPATEPVGTLTTHDRYGIARVGDFDQWEEQFAGDDEELLADVLFRMLEPHEVAAAMAFDPGFILTPRAKKRKVKLLGNAVTPPVAEIITSALVECLTGEDLARELVAA